MKFITYAIYIIAYEFLCLGGAGYVVFVLERNPLWILLGIILSMLCFRPESWGKL